MMRNISIHSQIVRESFSGLRKDYADWRGVLHECDIRAEDLDDPSYRFSIDQAVRLHRLALNLLDDETLGLLVKPSPRGMLRELALSAVHARTLGRALVRIIEVANLFKNTFRYSLEKRGGQVVLKLEPIPEQEVNNQFAIFLLLSIVHRLIGWLADERVVPAEIKLNFPPPDYYKESYRVFYGAPVHYNAKEISMAFYVADLELQIFQNETSVERYIRRYPVDLFIPVEMGGQLSREVRKQIFGWLENNHEMPNIIDIGKLMGKHPQMLRRQLKQERTSFKNIAVQVRRDIAMYYLGHEDSVEQIAEKAGYSDASSFIKAFKSWTGFTPLAFRKGFS